MTKNDFPIDFRKELETPSLTPSMRAWTNVGVTLNINIVGNTKQNKISQQHMTYGIKLVVQIDIPTKIKHLKHAHTKTYFQNDDICFSVSKKMTYHFSVSRKPDITTISPQHPHNIPIPSP
jgi:hypothetical protein